jgi:hypothetical protein
MTDAAIPTPPDRLPRGRPIAVMGGRLAMRVAVITAAPSTKARLNRCTASMAPVGT